ncbi:MAG TPA: riboflavin synthase [Pyrinomonadaceae bacterium]|nr:riboflavin synthase [Pyrinomonadaceae bacterium]
MFTGLIEEVGSVRSLKKAGGGSRITIAAEAVSEGTSDGDSISVNGVCLTALNVRQGEFSADLSPETLDRSTLGRLLPGSPVNLERAVTPSTRLGGHFVQGHVDGRGTLISAVQSGDFWTVSIAFPPELARFFVHKGSVAVEGISLTIAELRVSEFDIAVIPKTWQLTNLSSLAPGDPVNLEADVIAKYVERLMGVSETSKPSNGLTVESLKKHGLA